MKQFGLTVSKSGHNGSFGLSKSIGKKIKDIKYCEYFDSETVHSIIIIFEDNTFYSIDSWWDDEGRRTLRSWSKNKRQLKEYYSYYEYLILKKNNKKDGNYAN